jgi:hypothetical protein
MAAPRGCSMRILAAIISVAALMGVARAEDLPDQRPMLRIEPGMHTVLIQRIDVDAACTLMVTGSLDKTARLWALPQGERGAAELLRTLRVPIGDGYDGAIDSVALSPDGKWAAAAGYRYEGGHSVYIFEAATGRLAARLSGLGNVIRHLAFSPDGGRLAAMLGSGAGMRLWETSGWRLLAEDRKYGAVHSYAVAFDGANRLYTVAYDGQIRRYSPDGRLEAKAPTLGGKEPFSVAVHPQGRKLAIGFRDASAVEVYDARTLKRLYVADTPKFSDAEGFKVAWSPGGGQLYGGGQYWGGTARDVFIWQDEGRGKRSQTPLARGTILQLLPCGGSIAAGVSDPAFGLIGADGAKRVWQEGVTADMRDKKGGAFTLSADGKRVRFGLNLAGEQPVLFDLNGFRLTEARQPVAGLAEPKVAGVNVSDWENKFAPKLNGRPIALTAYEMSRAFAIAPEARGFVLGTDWWLRAYGVDGGERWKKDVPSVAWGVNVSRDGRLVVAAHGDGTIRWRRLSDGQELLALFVHAKDRRYVAWTPKGYYAASPGAEDLIGWHVNRDWDHAPDFYPASRFRDQFNRPDIVKRVLDDLDEDAAIAEANRLAGTRQAEDVGRKLPPIVTILSQGGGFSSESLTLRYSLRSPSGLAVSEVRALVDGRPLSGGSFRAPAGVNAASETEASVGLTGLPQRDVTVSLVARAGDIESTPAVLRLTFEGAAEKPAPEAAKGNAPTVSLYALVVGVGRFKDAKINGLAWAGQDAREFADALKRQQGRLYRKVEVRLLEEEKAESGAILDGLTWLKRQVGQGDVGVVFLAGHGVTDPGGDYYYVPYNAELEDVAGVLLPTRSTSVPDVEISRTLKNLAGNALFFFDTCHAGKAAGISFRGSQDYNKLINEIAGSANAVVLASSTGAELSQEREEWRHGAFTKALLEGLSGAADIYPKDGVITVDELSLYVKDRVKELTGGLQHPVDLKPREARNIAFAMP